MLPSSIASVPGDERSHETACRETTGEPCRSTGPAQGRQARSPMQQQRQYRSETDAHDSGDHKHEGRARGESDEDPTCQHRGTEQHESVFQQLGVTAAVS